MLLSDALKPRVQFPDRFIPYDLRGIFLQDEDRPLLWIRWIKLVKGRTGRSALGTESKGSCHAQNDKLNANATVNKLF
jgi:hypothetical protein